jgi:hypothetical protein
VIKFLYARTNTLKFKRIKIVSANHYDGSSFKNSHKSNLAFICCFGVIVVAAPICGLNKITRIKQNKKAPA